MEGGSTSSLNVGGQDASEKETDMKRMEDISKRMGEFNAKIRDICTRQGWNGVETPPVTPVAPVSHQSNVVQGSGRDHDNNLLTRFSKLSPNEFSGITSDPDVAEDWARNVERILKRVGGTTFDWIKITTFKLQGAARDW
ncbi:hypothetical protein MKX03_007157 [Papaver bracteatum]|nr:hypothetical protein MKX03_007157 [Papaver bracteatum]